MRITQDSVCDVTELAAAPPADADWGGEGMLLGIRPCAGARIQVKQDGITAAKGSGGGERDEGREGWEGKLVQGSAGRNSLERELRKKALQVEALCKHYMSYKKVVHCH